MIFVNGDSVTFGCELENKENRFSNIIAQKLDKEVVNISEVFKVNSNIVRSTIKWIEDNGNPEFAIIQFETGRRVEWYDPRHKSWGGLGHHDAQAKTIIRNGRIIKEPAKPVAVAYYSEFDNIHVRQMNMWTSIFFMETYLNHKNIPHYFWYGKGNPKRDKQTYELGIEYKQMSKWKDMKEMCDIIGTKNEHPENFPSLSSKKLEKGIHPNENGHKLLAEHFLEHIF